MILSSNNLILINVNKRSIIVLLQIFDWEQAYRNHTRMGFKKNQDCVWNTKLQQLFCFS